MSWSIKLFSVWGINVRVHLTFVLILAWAAFAWSDSPGAGISGAIFGIVAMLLLFGCITLHELGHSFLALRYGLRVRDIVLLPIGGVSQIEEMPNKPGQELAIAIVGPAISVAIAIVLFGISLLAGVQSSLASFDLSGSLVSLGWQGMLAYLAVANLILGVFNLIPAFPMDGGRALRALLAMRLDYRRATGVAVAVGQGLAMIAGLFGFINGNLILVLVAIFVWIGASQEVGMADVQDVLSGVRVGEVMTRQPLALVSSDTISRAVDLTLSTSQGDFPVLDGVDGRVIGLLTRDDLLRGLRSQGAATPVVDVMHTSFSVAGPNDPLLLTQRRMGADNVQVVPVVDGQKSLVGLLTATDIGEAFAVLSAKRPGRDGQKSG